MKKKIHPLIGFHTAGSAGNPTGIGDQYVHRLHDATIPVAITCADGVVGIGDALANSHPDDVLIYRVVRDGVESFAVPNYDLSPKQAADGYWALIGPFIAQEVKDNRDKVWVAFGNELDQERAEWIFSWSLEMARLMNAQGYRAVGPNWASGTPHYPAWETAAALAFLRYCGANPGKAAVGIHEYSYTVDDLFDGGQDKVGRFRHIVGVCQAKGIPRPAILIKEFGYEERQVPGPAKMVEDLKELFRRYPDYPPATLWWLGPGYGGIANKLQKAIDAVGKFVQETIVEVDLVVPVIVDENGGEEKPGDQGIKPDEPDEPAGNQRGIKLDFFKLLEDRSDFRINRLIWCEFRYDNLIGQDIPYGGIGLAIHRWTGSEWLFHFYQHSYRGKLRPQGGPPAGGSSHEDRWKADAVGIFALTPFLTFDQDAADKRDTPSAIVDGFHMGLPVYINIGSELEPGGRLETPPASLFAPPDGMDEDGDADEDDVVKPSEPAGDFGKLLWAQAQAKRVITLNPTAALQKVIFRDGFMPVTAEFRLADQGLDYLVQGAEHPGSGARRVYYVQDGQWSDVRYVTQAGSVSTSGTPPEEIVKPVIKDGDLQDVKPEEFRFLFWPSQEKKVTQRFGENPDIYAEFNLPGHEGIDLAAPLGTPYIAVAPGKVTRVSDKAADGKDSNYGWHVLIDHADGYTTLYAHARSMPEVKVGDLVTAGQIIAYSGNTGFTTGPHLHLTLRKKGHQEPGWPRGYMDPWPFLEPLYNDLFPPMANLKEGYLWQRGLEVRDNKLAVALNRVNVRAMPTSEAELLGWVETGQIVRILRDAVEAGYLYCEASVPEAQQPKVQREAPKGDRIDLLAYLRGDGRQFEVKNEWGSQERFQGQVDGSSFYLVKNAQWEQFFFDNDFIYRDIDTSPGGGRYYRLKDPDLARGSRWLRRHMAVGESYCQSRNVQFYLKAGGGKSAANSGNVTNEMKLVAHHQQYKFKTGLTIDDVVELLWVDGGERYFYARDFGLVGWARTHQDPNSPSWSAIAEIHKPGTREPFAREKIDIP